MLPAYITDRTPLTDARIRRRIQAGAPIYGTSPDRPTGPQRRVPFSQLSPEAYNALASLPIRSRQAGDAQRYVQDTGAIYAQAQALLVAWRKAGGPCDPPDFGDQAGDISGDNGPRTESAVRSFQRWANQNGGASREDGVLDQATLGQLVIVTADAVQAERRGPKSMWPWWVVGLGTAAAVLYAEYGGRKR